MRLCLLGYQIGYSKSPVLHAAFFAALGEKGSYGIEDIPPQDLGKELPRLLASYDGFNVTKPYKQTVAELLWRQDPVNTVKKDGTATSTDAEGFLNDYIEAFGAPKGKILLLGSGGAAKSILPALQGAEVTIVNRTFEKAEALAACVKNAVAKRRADGRYDAVINATSLGLHGEQAAPEELDFSGVSFAYDLVYGVRTPFLEKAGKYAKTRDGLGMLIEQAIASQASWRGKAFSNAEKEALRAAAKRALAAK